ncbi:NlpC/P60 family protein [Humibacter ginsenosidimutans]|uniref:C40 family peptidase n=1 Tax=Humibacter ginsenosidimutans TaxID=2599293 RepID=UPI00143D31D7
MPGSLTATTADGDRITLDKTQLTHAAQIIAVGNATPGVGRNGIQIALIAALTESSLRMLANTSVYPESGTYPNDGDGSDHDSLGLFQMRPQSGWGTVAQLMNPTYQAKAFFGGPNGPNHGSPRGLLDIPGWQQMSLGEASQSVEVSAFPDRYQNYQPVAAAILTALTGTQPTGQATSAETSTADVASAAETGTSSLTSQGSEQCTGSAANVAGDPGGDDGGGGFTPDAAAVATAIAFAEQQIGKPYVFGGAGPDSWDCSGLTMVAYQAAGVDIGEHSVSAQVVTMKTEGRLLPFSDRERGDLIFWIGPSGGFPHVAIYLGHDTILAAPTVGENVKIQPLWSTPDEQLYGMVGRPTGTP